METGTRLKDKFALITGGASGIGAETARQFAAEGAAVAIADLNGELGRAVADQINQSGGTARFRELDTTSEAQWIEVIGAVEQAFGGLHILVNSAGISGREPDPDQGFAHRRIEDQSLAGWERVMAVNATGIFLGTKHAVDPMRRAGGGSIINISSICGIVGSFANGAYHASKGAVRTFSKSAAIQYAADGIRVNSIHPGFVDSPMTEEAHGRAEVAQVRLAATPLGRFGQPIDIAMGCLYLAADESSWVTGSELVIDGGMIAN